MRILVICPGFPYPPTDGGKIRRYYTSKILAEHHTVDLLIISKEDYPSEKYYEDLRTNGDYNDVVLFSFPQYQFYQNALKGLIMGDPFQKHQYVFREAQRWVNKNINQYDLIHCISVQTAEYAMEKNVNKIIDLVDIRSKNYNSMKEKSNHIYRYLYNRESNELYDYEKKVIEQFDHSILISDSDRDYISDNNSNDRISIVENGVEEKLLSFKPTDTLPPKSIVFLGTMSYKPNITAVNFFVGEIFSKIQKDNPNIHFYIVGKNPTQSILELDEQPKIHVTGFVESPADYLSNAAVVVAPLQSGAGLQNKILEAMALSKPVVTTPTGFEGLDAIDGEHLFVESEPQRFAQVVSNLLNNAAERDRVGKNARDLISNEYTWESVERKLLNVIYSNTGGDT